MPEPGPLKGLDVIVEERLRQVEKLGYTIQHDATEHNPWELMAIGKCYIELAENQLEGRTAFDAWGEDRHPFWPSHTEIPWKPEPTPMENAAKGAAFVAASLDLQFALLMGEV